MAIEFSIEDLHVVFSRLASENWRAIIVGGQAVNLWAMKFDAELTGLDQYRPYTSRDLDFYGGRVEAKRLMEILGGKGKLNDGTDPSPNAAVIELPLADGRNLIIDVLTGVFGVSSSELIRTAVAWTLSESGIGSELRVMHPLLLLESKLACLRGLSQHGRQDEKHVRMMVSVVSGWLADQSSQPRTVYKAVERIAALMVTPDGLHAWMSGIELWDAVPLDCWRENEDFKLFFLKRLPQLQDEIEQRRIAFRDSFS